MAIERLALIDEANAATYFSININGQDYRISINELVDYMQGALTFPPFTGFTDYATQYAAPSSSGFSVQITNSSANTHLILTPTAGFAAGTLVLPSVVNLVDKQDIIVNSTQQVTTLTINGNGATVTGEPTTLGADDFFRLKYDLITNSWFRIG